MSEPKFNLSDYTHHVLKMAETNRVDNETALQQFITNLTTMKEHHKGASELNFHSLGQQWNKLLSKEKVAQKLEARMRLSKYPQRGKS